MPSAAEDVGDDEGEVGQGSEDYEGSDERGKSSRATNVNSTNDGVEDRASKRGVERISPCMVDLSDPCGKWRCAVAAQRPEHATGSEVAANVRAEHGQKDDDQKTDGAGVAVCRLSV